MLSGRGGWRWAVLIAVVLLGACAHQPAAVRQVSPSPALERILERGTVVVGTVGNMPPLNMTTRDGELMGLDVDLAQVVAAALGVTLEMKTMEFSRLLPALEAGQLDLVISSMTITPSRNRRFAFVGPYMITGKSILADRGLVAAVEGPADINAADITLTALEGSTSQALIESLFPAARLVTARDYDEAVGLLLAERADAMFADYSACVVYAHRYAGRGLVALGEPLTYEPLGIAVPPGDPLLVNLLQNLLLRLEGSGDMDKLHERWFMDTSWVELLPDS